MRGRSPCVRYRSQLWQQRRHMLVIMNDKTLSRRAVVAVLPLLLAVCSGGYRSITVDIYSVAFVSMQPDLMRQEVAYGAPYRTGTVVVNIRERRLYLVQAGGRALRYAVGVGRAEARNFHGSAVIGRKEPWPSWTPTANMMRAMPHYRAYATGFGVRQEKNHPHPSAPPRRLPHARSNPPCPAHYAPLLPRPHPA